MIQSTRDQLVKVLDNKAMRERCYYMVTTLQGKVSSDLGSSVGWTVILTPRRSIIMGLGKIMDVVEQVDEYIICYLDNSKGGQLVFC